MQKLTLALFGATGGTGRQLLTRALDRGHHVVALARTPGALDPRPGLRVVGGDATDPAAVQRTLAGADAVLVALGAPALARTRIRTEGTRTIVAAMREAGIRRIGAVSLLGAHESRDQLTFFLRRLFFPLYLRRAVVDHEDQESLLAASDLDYVIARPPHLNDGPAQGTFAHGFDDTPGLTFHLSRADLADFLLDEMERPRYRRQAVGLSDRRPAPAPVPA